MVYDRWMNVFPGTRCQLDEEDLLCLKILFWKMLYAVQMDYVSIALL